MRARNEGERENRRNEKKKGKCRAPSLLRAVIKGGKEDRSEEEPKGEEAKLDEGRGGRKDRALA